MSICIYIYICLLLRLKAPHTSLSAHDKRYCERTLTSASVVYKHAALCRQLKHHTYRHLLHQCDVSAHSRNHGRMSGIRRMGTLHACHWGAHHVHRADCLVVLHDRGGLDCDTGHHVRRGWLICVFALYTVHGRVVRGPQGASIRNYVDGHRLRGRCSAFAARVTSGEAGKSDDIAVMEWHSIHNLSAASLVSPPKVAWSPRIQIYTVIHWVSCPYFPTAQ
jgi:hypothetical protein